MKGFPGHRLYRLTLAPGEATDVFASAAPRLFVWYESGTLVTRPSAETTFARPVTAGSYAFDDHAFHGALENGGDAPLVALVAVWALVDGDHGRKY